MSSSSTSHSLILPSRAPLARRPSLNTARDSTGAPCVSTTGSPVPFAGQSLILPSSPPLASRPSRRTARDVTEAPCVSTTDPAVVAAAGQPPVWQHCQRHDVIAVREHRLLTRAVPAPELDRAI